MRRRGDSFQNRGQKGVYKEEGEQKKEVDVYQTERRRAVGGKRGIAHLGGGENRTDNIILTGRNERDFLLFLDKKRSKKHMKGKDRLYIKR